MIKRRWPDFYDLCQKSKHDLWWNFLIEWLEFNIPKEVLDKIAPPICEKHEPILYKSTSTVHIIPNEPVLIGTCKHCGAEIRPSGWELKT